MSKPTLPTFLYDLMNGMEYKIKCVGAGSVSVGYVSEEDVNRADSTGWLALWPVPVAQADEVDADPTHVRVDQIATIRFTD